ncbi:MAG: serine acetyltransferase [Sphingobium sp.]|uniref:serine O-acetyltransferase EpsC n=1 Tax=Sphingobium sp. TaxID=1912891 RepID=UPI0029A42040|nr:serine O-acetyltransferase EpsC [Sphingobium sp.]MDX3908442.1 serine acetyltransferase [Sphingobium sp.]
MTDIRDNAAEAKEGYWDLDRIVGELSTARTLWRQSQKRHIEYGAEGFPSRANLAKIMASLCGALFPLRLGPSFVRIHNEDAFVAETLQTSLSRLYGQIRLELGYTVRDVMAESVDVEAARIIGAFADSLPAQRVLLDTDVEAAFVGDPAARSVDEVLICYPSMLAIIHHRLAHQLYRLGAPVVARIISEIAHSKTGIDIHPGATIGEGFFIDHGNGVVIGETTIIGSRVRLYQGVTLGARSLPVDESGQMLRDVPRHPIIEDDVVIYAGATVLGRIIVGTDSVIGGNVWLTESVPAGSHVRQAKADHQVTRRADFSAPHRTRAANVAG